MRGPESDAARLRAALAVLAVMAQGCSCGTSAVNGFVVRQETPGAGMAPPGCAFQFTATGDHGSLEVDDVLPCVQTDEGFWIAEATSTDNVAVHYDASLTRRDSVVARFRLALGINSDTGDDTDSDTANTPEYTGQVGLDDTATVTMDNGASFALYWDVAYLH